VTDTEKPKPKRQRLPKSRKRSPAKVINRAKDGSTLHVDGTVTEAASAAKPKPAKWQSGGPSPNPGGKRKAPRLVPFDPTPQVEPEPDTDQVQPEAAQPENLGSIPGRNANWTFAKGFSANPAGKPKGARHRATRLAEALIDDNGELLVRQALSMAMAGDPTAMRLCLERLISPRRERPVEFALPTIRSAADVVEATNAIAAAVAAGELSTSEAANMSVLVSNVGKSIELVDIERRLAAVESFQTK
jgi:hypothetical protein